MHMKPLSPQQLATWRKDAEVLEKDRYGEKVLKLADGTFLKLFRCKRWFSKAWLFPPAIRFAENASQLKKLGIPCPGVLEIFKLSSPKRSIVHYEPLAGMTLRELIQQDSADNEALLTRLIPFVMELHNLGVYFRSLHLGNIVLTPDHQFGLIDISDMHFKGKPLSRYMRKRNLRHLMRYQSDWEIIDPAIRQKFESIFIQ